MGYEDSEFNEYLRANVDDAISKSKPLSKSIDSIISSL